MNMDFGLFHLLIAFRSIPKTNNSAPTQEGCPSKLPEINYALLSWTLPRPESIAKRIRPTGAAFRQYHKKVGI
jgi:hypothetical protein